MARRSALPAILLSWAAPTRPFAPVLAMAQPVPSVRRRNTAPFCVLKTDIFTVPSDATNAEEDGAAPAGKKFERKYMIDKYNDVLRLQCPNPQVLQQGILETAELPQICIAGESNAGKSSLINHMLNKKSLAKSSSVAGKTRSVDMMVVNEKLVLTDLPGLPSRDHQVAAMWEKSWEPLVFQYIRRCEGLRCMLYVHDVRWKITHYVRSFLEEVEGMGLPVLLVLTKDDRIVGELRPAKKGERETPEEVREAEHLLRQRLMKRARKSLAFEGVHIHYSTDSTNPSCRKARRRMLRYLESIVATGSREECSELLAGIYQEKFAHLDQMTVRELQDRD